MGFFQKLFKRKPKNEKLSLGLHKTQNNLNTLTEILKSSKQINNDLYDKLEEIFISADIGIDTVLLFMDKIKDEVKATSLTNPLDLQSIIIDKLFKLYLQDDILTTDLNYQENTKNVYLIVGVNGTGKTTSIAKIAYLLKNEGKKVLVIAGDTFRAGAILQLETWSKRAGVDFFAKTEGADPSSVIYDGLEYAKKQNIDCIIIDTAGRLHNKQNLMNELAKMHRTIDKVIPASLRETLLVIDATTGQNGLVQAKVFNEITKVTGIILTKLDGTAKGGIVLAIRHQYGLPIKFIGVGEKLDDLIPFDIESYIYGLFKGFFE